MCMYTHICIYACVHLYACTRLRRIYYWCLTPVLALFDRFKGNILWSLDGTTVQMIIKASFAHLFCRHVSHRRVGLFFFSGFFLFLAFINPCRSLAPTNIHVLGYPVYMSQDILIRQCYWSVLWWDKQKQLLLQPAWPPLPLAPPTPALLPQPSPGRATGLGVPASLWATHHALFPFFPFLSVSERWGATAFHLGRWYCYK